MCTNRYKWLWLLLGAPLLAGCIADLPRLGWKSRNPVPAQNQTAAPSVASVPRKDPYTIQAQASGTCINFTLTNLRESELAVSPFHFAYIPEGTRRVVPYDAEAATIDVPASVPPGQSVQGRAVFNEFPAPGGGRLVFKPDRDAAYCVIKRVRLQ